MSESVPVPDSSHEERCRFARSTRVQIEDDIPLKELLLLVDYYQDADTVFDGGYPQQAMSMLSSLLNSPTCREFVSEDIRVAVRSLMMVSSLDVVGSVDFETGTIINVSANNHLYALAVYMDKKSVCVDVCNAGLGAENMHTINTEFGSSNIYACVPLMRFPFGKTQKGSVHKALDVIRAVLLLRNQIDFETRHVDSTLFVSLLPELAMSCPQFYSAHTDAWRWASVQRSGSCYMRNVLLAIRSILIGSGRFTLEDVLGMQSALKLAAMRRLHDVFLTDRSRALRIHHRYLGHAMNRMLEYDLVNGTEDMYTTAVALQHDMLNTHTSRWGGHEKWAMGNWTRDARTMMVINGLHVRDVMVKVKKLMSSETGVETDTTAKCTLKALGKKFSAEWFEEMDDMFLWGNMCYSHAVLTEDLKDVTFDHLHVDIMKGGWAQKKARYGPMRKLVASDSFVMSRLPHHENMPTYNDLVDMFYAILERKGATRRSNIFNRLPDHEREKCWEICAGKYVGHTTTNNGNGDGTLFTEADWMRKMIIASEMKDLMVRMNYVEFPRNPAVERDMHRVKSFVYDIRRPYSKNARPRSTQCPKDAEASPSTFSGEPPQFQDSSFKTLPQYREVAGINPPDIYFGVDTPGQLMALLSRVDTDALFLAHHNVCNSEYAFRQIRSRMCEVGDVRRIAAPLLRFATRFAEAIARWAYHNTYTAMPVDKNNMLLAARYEEFVNIILTIRIMLVAAKASADELVGFEVIYDSLRDMFVERLHVFSHLISLRFTCDALYALDVLPYPFGRKDKSGVDYARLGKAYLLAVQHCKLVTFTPRVGVHMLKLLQETPAAIDAMVSGMREVFVATNGGVRSSAKPRGIFTSLLHSAIEVDLTEDTTLTMPLLTMSKHAPDNMLYGSIEEKLAANRNKFHYRTMKRGGRDLHVASAIVGFGVDVETFDFVDIDVHITPRLESWVPSSEVTFQKVEREDPMQMSPPPLSAFASVCEQVAIGTTPYEVKVGSGGKGEVVMCDIALKTGTEQVAISPSRDAASIMDKLTLRWNERSLRFTPPSRKNEETYISALGIPGHHFRLVTKKDLMDDMIELELLHEAASPSWAQKKKHRVLVTFHDRDITFTLKDDPSTDIIPTACIASSLQEEHGLPTCYIDARRVAKPSTILVWRKRTQAEAIISTDGAVRIKQDTYTKSLMLVDGEDEFAIRDAPQTLHPAIGVPYADYPGVWVWTGTEELFKFSNADIASPNGPMFRTGERNDPAVTIMGAFLKFASPTSSLHTMHVTREGGVHVESSDAAIALARLCASMRCVELLTEVLLTSGIKDAPNIRTTISSRMVGNHYTIQPTLSLVCASKASVMSDEPLPKCVHGLRAVRQTPPSMSTARSRPHNDANKRRLRYVAHVLNKFATSLKTRLKTQVARRENASGACNVFGSKDVMGRVHGVFTFLMDSLEGAGGHDHFKVSGDMRGLKHFMLKANDTNMTRGLNNCMIINRRFNIVPTLVTALTLCKDTLLTTAKSLEKITKTPDKYAVSIPPSAHARIVHNVIHLVPATLPAKVGTDIFKEASRFPSPQAFREAVAMKWSDGWADLYWPGASAKPRHIALVEMERGFSLRPHQERIVKELVERTKTDGISLRELIMGAGKSSAIIPALAAYIIEEGSGKCVVIVPPHLEDSTRVLSGALVSKWLGVMDTTKYNDIDECKNMCVWNVNEYKDNVVREQEVKVEKATCIIDEHDSLINPTTSELNLTMATGVFPDALPRVLTIRKIMSWILRPHAKTSRTPSELLATLNKSSIRSFPHNHFTNVESAREVYLPDLPHQELFHHKIAPILTQRMGVTFGWSKRDQVDVVPFKAKGISDEESTFEDFDVRATLNLIPRIATGLTIRDVRRLLQALPTLTPYELAETEWEYIAKSDVSLYRTLSEFRGLDETHQTEIAERVHGRLGRQTKSVHFIELFIKLVLVPELQIVPTSKKVVNGTIFSVTRHFKCMIAMTGTPVVYKLFDEKVGELHALQNYTKEPGTDDHVRNVFTNKAIMNVDRSPLPSTDANVIKRLVRTLRGGKRPYRAFIDAAAAIVSVPSRDVARAIADAKPPGVHHVGFVEENTFARLAIVVSTGHEVPLTSVNEHVDGRFMYFDQANTVGVDVDMPKKCVAILTINEGMTLTTASQAAYRMRKLGPDTQHIEVWSSTGARIYETLLHNRTTERSHKQTMHTRQFLEMLKRTLTKSPSSLTRYVPPSEKERAMELVKDERECYAAMVARMDEHDAIVMGAVRARAVARTTTTNTLVTKGTHRTTKLSHEQERAISDRRSMIKECGTEYYGVETSTKPIDPSLGEKQYAMGVGWRRDDEKDAVVLMTACVKSKALYSRLEGEYVIYDADTLVPIYVGKDSWVDDLFSRFDMDVINAKRLSTRSTLLSWDSPVFNAEVPANPIVIRKVNGKDTTPYEVAYRAVKNIIGVEDDKDFIPIMMRAAKRTKWMRSLVDEDNIVRALMNIELKQHDLKARLLDLVVGLNLGANAKARVEQLETLPESEMVHAERLLEESGEMTPEDVEATELGGWTQWLGDITHDNC